MSWLRSFTLIFLKNSLIEVNVDDVFLTSVVEFINYEIKTLPFKYLGFSVGAKPRLGSTWEPLVNLMTKRIILGSTYMLVREV